MKRRIIPMVVSLIFVFQCFPLTVLAINAPTGLLARQESPVNSSTVGLSWNRVGGSEGYVVYDNNIFVRDVGKNNFCTLTGVSAGAHQYTVKAYDRNGNYSQASAAKTVQIYSAVEITKYGSKNSKVNLEWQLPTKGFGNNSCIAKAIILRDGAAYGTVKSGQFNFTDNKIAPNVNYNYSVVYRSKDGFYSASSVPVSILNIGEAPSYKPVTSLFSKLFNSTLLSSKLPKIGCCLGLGSSLKACLPGLK